MPRSGRSIGFVVLALCAAHTRDAAAAQEQLPRAQRSLGPQELLPVDASFFQLAAATGGDFYFWCPGEFAAAADRLRIPLGGEALLLSYDDLGSSGTRTFRVPVDGAVERLELFAGAQRLDRLRVTRPSGLALGESDPAVDWQRFQRMQIIGVDHPEPGTWLVELGGAGRSALTLHARVPGSRSAALAPGAPMPIECVGFDFVERAGRPGHEGLMPVKRAPGPGEEALIRVHLSGTVREVEVQLVDLAGAPLAPPTLPLPVPEEDEELYVPLVVPARTFRVLVRGFDSAGLAVQRVFSGSVDPTRDAASAADLPLKD